MAFWSWIEATWGWIVLASELAALWLTPRILLSRKPSGTTFAWLLGVWFLPVLGPMLFVTFGRERILRGLPRRKRRAAAATRQALGDDFFDPAPAPLPTLSSTTPSAPAASASAAAAAPANALVGRHGFRLDPDDALTPDLAQLARAAERLCDAPLLGGNEVELLSCPAAMYDLFVEDMQRATESMHVQFYIWRDDWTGNRLADVLIARARDGLEVRLLLDAVGCMDMGADLIARLTEAGVEVAFFHSVNPLQRRFNVNFRNHRKIVVLDGRVGYTGGINVGDEHLGLSDEIGPWRDTAVRIVGPAVRALQRIFCEDWTFVTDRLPPQALAFPPLLEAPGTVPIQVIPSGPDEDLGNIHRVYFLAVTLARRRFFLTTPYFIPDDALEMALETAAMRGVDVRVLVPRRSDNPLVDAAGRAYVVRMLRAGVRVFFYELGFIHAKTVVVDGLLGSVGSANMDVRSFRLNFEAQVLIYDRRLAEALEQDFERDLRGSREATLADLEGRRTIWRTLDELARLASPML